ncbi:MAG: molybdenum cofactor guanylyltransferase [Candidatus Zixiibacteriota bacterium]|nr:MAG: molybdenum cofactor guanylyltransferase [candidate division Zixibacteria bacterium]
MDGLGRKKSNITGFIIAGGKSERFGRDKRKLLISGKTLIDRTIGILEDILGRHPFVVGDNLGEFQIDPEFVIGDAQKDSGPLGGIVAALEKCETAWGLMLAVDLPDITVRDLESLVTAADESFDFISLSAGEKSEPLIALYHSRTAPFWRNQLNKAELMIAVGLKRLRCKSIFPDGGIKSLRNINEPDDIVAG